MKRLTLIVALLLTACTKNPYPGVDNPTQGQNSSQDKEIIAYIDKRLVEE
jgi:outer membrane biogenesis lipoprotein LolB